MPVIALSPSPKTSIETAIHESFLNTTNERYLVIPIWTEYPIYYTGGEGLPSVAGEGFFIRNDEITDLHKKIPRKFIIGVGSIVANIASDVELYGVMLISENIDAVFVETTHYWTNSIFDLNWRPGISRYIDDEDSKRIKNMFDNNKIDNSLLLDIYLRSEDIE